MKNCQHFKRVRYNTFYSNIVMIMLFIIIEKTIFLDSDDNFVLKQSLAIEL